MAAAEHIELAFYFHANRSAAWSILLNTNAIGIIREVVTVKSQLSFGEFPPVG
jgi:hypothetical protein